MGSSNDLLWPMILNPFFKEIYIYKLKSLKCLRWRKRGRVGSVPGPGRKQKCIQPLKTQIFSVYFQQHSRSLDWYYVKQLMIR